jgi:hypothetical protein
MTEHFTAGNPTFHRHHSPVVGFAPLDHGHDGGDLNHGHGDLGYVCSAKIPDERGERITAAFVDPCRSSYLEAIDHERGYGA